MPPDDVLLEVSVLVRRLPRQSLHAERRMWLCMLQPHRGQKRVSQSRSKVGHPVGGGPARCGEESWDSGKVGLSQDEEKIASGVVPVWGTTSMSTR